MDDLVGVGIRHRLTHLLERRHEPATFGGWVGTLGQEFIEGATADQLHRQERATVGKCAKIVDGWNGRVLQLAGDPRFVGEPAGRTGRHPEPVLKHLHRDFPRKGGIGGAEDHAHAAAGDLITQLVPPGGRGRASTAPRRGGIDTGDGGRVGRGGVDRVGVGHGQLRNLSSGFAEAR